MQPAPDADDAVLHGLEAPLLITMQNNFCIRMPFKLVAFLFQFLSYFRIVINLTIKNYMQTLVVHRLITTSAKVYNRKAAVP